MNSTSAPNAKPSKLNFSLKYSEQVYNLSIIQSDQAISFIIEDLKDFPVKVYELKTSLKELKEKDENFLVFKNSEKLLNGIKTCIDSEKYLIKYNENENCIIFIIKNEFFDGGAAKLKIPEKEQDLKTQVECLTKAISQFKTEKKNKEKIKNEEAENSFKGTAFLNNDEKKMISKWIDPEKIIKFNLLFSTNIDGDNSSTFHYYCDGIFPTVTVILDTSGRRFGGYTTQSWGQSNVGGSYSRAIGSFIFNLSNKQKYNLLDPINSNGKNSIYRHNSYGPTFGSGHDLYLASQCKSSTNSYCSKSSYDTGNNNLLGNGGQTNFQVSYYEVYSVNFE